MQLYEEPPQFVGGERPRPQGSSPVEEYPEATKYTDRDKEVQCTKILLSYTDIKNRAARK